MEVLIDWPDAELVLMELLSPVALTGTATPPDLTAPFVRINRTGGDDDGITDFPVLEVGCYAPDRAVTGDATQPAIPGREEAWAMQGQCRQIILASIRKSVTYTDKDGNQVTALIDNAKKAVTPQQPPYGDQAVKWVNASYRLSMRRPTITAP